MRISHAACKSTAAGLVLGLSAFNVKAEGIQRDFDLGIDAAYNRNVAGQVARGQAIAQYKGTVNFGLGGGIVDFSYFKRQFYGLASLGFDTSLGGNSNLYGRTSYAYFPSTDTGKLSAYSYVYGRMPKPGRTVTQYFQTLDLGTSFDLYNRLRMGFELSGKLSETDFDFNQDHMYFGVGASYRLNPLTVYAINRMTFDTPTPINQAWYEFLAPWHYETVVGANIPNVSGGTSLNFEVKGTQYSIGGSISSYVDLDILNFEPSVSVTKTNSLLAKSTEVMFGISGEFGEVSRLSAKYEFGGESVTSGITDINNDFMPTDAEVWRYEQWSNGSHQYIETRYDVEQIHYSYQIDQGEITVEDWIETAYPNSTITSIGIDPRNNTAGGVRNRIYYLELEDGSRTSFRVPDAENLIRGLQITTGMNYGKFASILFESKTLGEFAAHYKDATFEEKIQAAAALAAYGSAGYDSKAANSSAFSPRRMRASNITPEVVYQNVRSRAIDSGNTNSGFCANINGMAVDFLRKVDINAYSISVGTNVSAHIVALALDSESKKGYIVDYGEVISEKGKGMWPVIQAYHRMHGVNLLGIHIWQDGNSNPVFIKGPEGRLMDTALGTDVDLLSSSLTKSKTR